MWSLLFLALGTAMFLEGLPYFLSPRAVRSTMRFVSRLQDGSLRLVGIALMAAGLLVAYLATR
jgi:uncharacterized protein YjeT (DUF2065 family)